jgi:hypothetical protein
MLPFTKRTMTAVTVFACLSAAHTVLHEPLTTNVAQVSATHLARAQL